MRSANWSTRFQPHESHTGDQSQRKNAPTMSTAMGRKNTSTGLRVSPPIANAAPQKSTSDGSANTSAGFK